MTTTWVVLLEGCGVCMYPSMQTFILCKNVLNNTPKNRQGSNKHAGSDKKTMSWDTSDTHTNRADQKWNVTRTSWVQQEGGKYSWHTNRKWLEPPHNGVSCIFPPHHTIPHFSLTHLCLWSLKIIVLILLTPVTPTPPTLYNPRYFPHSISSSVPSWPTPSSHLSSAKSSNKNKKL